MSMQSTERDYQERLFERLKKNEETARKFFEVEVSVLSILNFKDFFDRLMNEIMDKFGVSYVWISLISSSRAYNLVKSFVSSEEFLRHLNVIEYDDFHGFMGNDTQPRLINTGLNKLTFLLPFDQTLSFKSVALVPITFDGKVAGSLNFADLSVDRFRPGLDPWLLEQLGVVVSICLSNVAAHEELKALAFKDPLTGLLNRRAMEKALKREFSRARRYIIPLAVVFVDLDNFKETNDSFGHDIGDEMLKFAANAMLNLSRQSDVIARFAGDEFVLILPETSMDEAQQFIERIQNYLMGHKLDIGDAQIECSFSYGIASAGDEEVCDPAALLRKADERLILAKTRKGQRRQK